MTNIAIIPARGGSERVKYKNKRNFCGKPLIWWTIEEARLSGLFSDIIVSTDDTEIQSIAQSAGVTCKKLRPTHLAANDTKIQEVIKHHCDQIQLY